MTAIEERNVSKFELWGGPEDGLEVEVLSGNLQVVVDSPSTQASRNRSPYGDNANQSPPTLRRARYIWNRDKKRFEWKEYLP